MRNLQRLSFQSFLPQQPAPPSDPYVVRGLEHQKCLERIAQKGALLLASLLDRMAKPGLPKTYENYEVYLTDLMAEINCEKKLCYSVGAEGGPSTFSADEARNYHEMADILKTLCDSLRACSGNKKERKVWEDRLRETIHRAYVQATEMGVLIIESTFLDESAAVAV